MMTLKEAAIKFGISHPHLRLMCSKGRLPAEKIGRDWFLIGSVESILKAIAAAPKRGTYPRPDQRRK